MSCNSLFVLAPRFNKKNYYSKINQAIEAIKSNKSIVAIEVMKAIESKSVRIKSFFEISKDDYKSLREDDDYKGLRILSNRYPPNDLSVNMIEDSLNGIIFNETTIYISSKLTSCKMALSIIHEVWHHLNSDLCEEELESLNDKLVSYRDEIRSFSAETMFSLNGRCLMRHHIKDVHKDVSRLYQEFLVGNDNADLGYITSVLDF